MLSLITHWCPDLSSLAHHLLFRSGRHPAVNLGVDDVLSKITGFWLNTCGANSLINARRITNSHRELPAPTVAM
jgi:hypothetical protein